MTVEAIATALRAAGCVYAEDEAALLVAAEPDPVRRAGLVTRRAAGVPLEVLLGWVEVAGVRLLLGPGVFVPRARSQLLVREAVRALSATPRGTLLDLCCGCGVLGRLVLDRLPGIRLVAVDIDPVAAQWARRNLAAVGGVVAVGDLYDAVPPGMRGAVDVIVANAPYVPSAALASMPREAREHEPRRALDGGPDGVDVQRRIAAGAGEWLAPGGVLVVETSAAQAALTAQVLAAAGLRGRIVVDDDVGGTVAVATRS